MFSVVIPLYNKEKYIAKSILSVLEQTYPDFELIIVDDGSTDNSVAEAKILKDDRIRIIYQKNAGVSCARNKGISESKFDLIAFLDADDLWEKDFLETMIRLVRKYNGCSVFAVNYQFMLQNNQLRLPIIKGLPDFFKEGVLNNYFQIASQSDPLICSISLIVKKEAIKSIGGFPEDIRAGEDLLTWARLAAHFDIAYTTQPKATFCRWDTYEHNKPRVPDSHNRVADELRRLLIEGDKDKIKGLEEYIAYWHKIRVAIFLRLDKQKKAREEFKMMSEFAEKNIKYLVYAILVYLPLLLMKKLLAVTSYYNDKNRCVTKSKEV